MTLIAILLALGVERLASQYRDHGLYEIRGGVLARLRARLPRERLWQSPLWAAGLLLVPTALVAILRDAVPTPMLRMLYDAFWLFLCLGPRDLTDDIHRLIAARESGDGAAVRRLTGALKSGPMPDADQRSLLGALFVQSHERLFGVLAWFVIGGPGGALFYRLASRLPRVFVSVDAEAARFVRYAHTAAAWVPARLTALLLALAGSTDDAFSAWRRLPTTESWARRTWTLLAQVSAASLIVEEHGAHMAPPRLETALKEVLRMQRRALLMLLALFALYTAGAWLA